MDIVAVPGQAVAAMKKGVRGKNGQYIKLVMLICVLLIGLAVIYIVFKTVNILGVKMAK